MKILDGGSDAGRLNLVLISEAYIQAELPRFRKDARELVGAITREPWFRPELMNIHAIEVASKDPGNHLQPDRGPLDTAFKARYGGPGLPGRYISLDNRAVREFVKKSFTSGPYHIGVLIGSSQRTGGGALRGEDMFWTATEPLWTRTGLHEMGHSIGNLHDEYEYGGVETFKPEWNEPSSSNVSKYPDGGGKWEGFPDVVPREGAGHSRKGLWRPYLNCKMRWESQPFCKVCEASMVWRLESFLSEDPQESEKESPADSGPGFATPSVWKPFVDVPSGTIAIMAGTKGRSFPDNSAGAMEAVQWILKRQFG